MLPVPRNQRKELEDGALQKGLKCARGKDEENARILLKEIKMYVKYAFLKSLVR